MLSHSVEVLKPDADRQGCLMALAFTTATTGLAVKSFPSFDDSREEY